MINYRSYMNGILAVVLSASLAPASVAFAAPAADGVKHASKSVKKPVKHVTSAKDDAAKATSPAKPGAGDAEPGEK